MANDAQSCGGTINPPFQDSGVTAAFEAFETCERASLLELRRLIFDVALQDPRIGVLIETLKWGQPSYLPKRANVGTTVRLGIPKSGGFGMYTHCQTNLVADFASQHGADLTFDGNRGVLFESGADLPKDILRLLITRALTYHLKS